MKTKPAAKPTAGKWRLKSNEFATWIASEKDISIAKIFRPNDMSSAEAQANARLLVMAPELLEAVTFAEKTFNKSPVEPLQAFIAIEMLRNLINKANR